MRSSVGWVSTALLMLVVGCGSGNPELQVSGLRESPGSGEVPVCQSDAHGDTKATSGFSSEPDNDVLVESLLASPPGDGFRWLDTVLPSFGIQVGERSDGKAFVVVVTASEGSNESELVTFSDDDGDSLPEQTTRSTVATIQGATMAFAALHEASGTLYVIDAKNNRVLRFEDTDGDKVPDATNSVFVSATQSPFTLTSLGSPTESSVKLIGNAKPQDVLRRERVATAEDTDDDGVADQIAENVSAKVTFLVVATAGDIEVDVHCDSTGQYEIVAVSSTATTQLATFGAKSGTQEVTLSRGPTSDERLQIRNETTSAVLAETPVLAANWTRIEHVANTDGPIVDGGVFHLKGSGITGQEVVEAIVASSETGNWSACTIESSTTEELECELPDLQLTKTTAVMIRVFKNANADDPIFVRRVYVAPDGP